MKEYWKPEYVIALTIIFGCLLLIALNINGEVKTIFGGAVAWTFRSIYQRQKEEKASSGKAK